MRNLALKPEYTGSYALVVGINDYATAPPLKHAANDAQAVADILKTRFGFREEDITLLLQKDATRANIMSLYLRFGQRAADPDSRLIMFFAGHGVTKPSSRGDVGFLVPHDGHTDDLSTLIRWEEFTSCADLIPAKHVLFVMDACYGGLVFNRAVSAGTVRFLKDMLLRPVRQALTAGKADEAVADAGGPRAGHSIFTSHLLDALEGAAKSPDGILTASGVMSYVYKKVSGDIHSEQTPHYGFLSGDGDFVFDAPQMKSMSANEEKDVDVLVSVSSLEIPESQTAPADTFAVGKQYLSDPKYSIQLHDLVIHHVRKVIVETRKEALPVQNVQFSKEELSRRLLLCENATQDLRRLLACVAYWGSATQRHVLSKAFARITDHLETENGLVIWNSLRWYPAILLCYSTGIAALANENYANLGAALRTPVSIPYLDSDLSTFILALGEQIFRIEGAEAFKYLPGHEKFRVPRSEYLFKLLQPELDDDLFLGKEYERLFDRFEVLLALIIANDLKSLGKNARGPVGRFAWKFHRPGVFGNPLLETLKEAEKNKESWLPFEAGLFGPSFASFFEMATEYAQMIGNFGW